MKKYPGAPVSHTDEIKYRRRKENCEKNYSKPKRINEIIAGYDNYDRMFNMRHMFYIPKLYI